MLGFMDPSDTSRTQGPRYTPLFLRVVAVNAVLLMLACVGTLFVISPNRFSLSSIAAKEAALVVGVLIAVAVLNVALLRRVFSPLERMAALARRFDPRRTGQRVPIDARESEVTDVARAFNDMLERLEHERRATSRRVLDAQEGERLRVAQDLHDQVGQTLTAALLELEHVAGRVPDGSRPELEAVQEIVQLGLEDIRRIARELRPEALDDLGLPSALAALTERFARQARLEIELRVDPELPRLSREAELVIYRVAQEALTNVARHSGSQIAELRLERSGPDRVTLVVADHGHGLTPEASAGGGMQGMAERASTVEAALNVANRDGGGAQIRLDVPTDKEGLWYR
jgi:two-component system, NarL family, sensor histidine kinase UhpB